MKKLSFLLLFFPLITLAQKGKDTTRIFMPIKDGKIFYERIESVDSTLKKDELYTRSLKWMADMFVDSKEVIRLADKESGKIVGQGIFDIVTNSFFGFTTRVAFMIDVTVKDGKYRVQLYQYQYKLLDNKYATDKFSPLEGTWERFDQGKSPSPKDDKRLFVGVEVKSLNLVANLKKTLGENSNSSDF